MEQAGTLHYRYLHPTMTAIVQAKLGWTTERKRKRFLRSKLMGLATLSIPISSED